MPGRGLPGPIVPDSDMERFNGSVVTYRTVQNSTEQFTALRRIAVKFSEEEYSVVEFSLVNFSLCS